LAEVIGIGGLHDAAARFDRHRHGGPATQLARELPLTWPTPGAGSRT